MARKAKTCVEESSGSVDLSSLSSGVGRSHRADTRGGVEILHWNKFSEQSVKMFFLETETAKRVWYLTKFYVQNNFYKRFILINCQYNVYLMP